MYLDYLCVYVFIFVFLIQAEKREKRKKNLLPQGEDDIFISFKKKREKNIDDGPISSAVPKAEREKKEDVRVRSNHRCLIYINQENEGKNVSLRSSLG